MREEQNTSSNVSFNRYHTRSYINDDSYYGNTGENNAPYDTEYQSDTLPTSFITSKRIYKPQRETSGSKNTEESPGFFEEFFKKHDEQPTVSYTEIPLTKRKKDLGEEYASIYSTSEYIDQPPEEPAPEANVKATDYGAEHFGEEDADSFFANNRISVESRAESYDSWTPQRRDRVSRREVVEDMTAFAEAYGTDDSEEKITRSYDEFIRRKNKGSGEEKSGSERIFSYSEKDLEIYEKYLRSGEIERDGLNSEDDDREAAAVYDSFIRRKETVEEMNALIKAEEEKRIVAEYERMRAREAGIADSLATGEANSEEEELRRLAAEEERRSIFEKMTKRDLDVFLKRNSKRENSLLRKASSLRKKINRSDEFERINLSAEFLNVTRELILIYITNLRACVSAGSFFRRKKYSSRLTSFVDEYNRYLSLWCSLTASSVPPLPQGIAKDIEGGGKAPVIMTFSVRNQTRKKLSPEEKKERYEEALRLLKEEEERAKRSSKNVRVHGERDGDLYTKKGINSYFKLDTDTVKARIDYRIEKLNQVILLENYRYGQLSEDEKKEKRRVTTYLEILKRGRHKIISEEKRDNKRYAKVLTEIPELAKLKPGADRERMSELAERIKRLLLERDEVNQQLLTLYTGTDVTGKQTVYSQKKIRKVRKRGASKSYRGQKRIYDEVRKFRVPLKQKQQIYELINKKTELSAYISECTYRMKLLPKNSPERREYAAEIKRAKKKIKYATRDIKALAKKNAKRSKKEPNPKIQILWLILLLLIVGAAFAVYYFFGESIMNALTSSFNNHFG